VATAFEDERFGHSDWSNWDIARERALIGQISLINICTAERLQRNSLVSCVG
jgi:hypothetical protein